jgi:Ca2+-binding EF-hand superfamily protein
MQSTSKKKELKLAFDVYDTDRSGSISYTEIRNVLKKLNLHSSTKDVQSLMKEFDRNKDGHVSFDG